MEKEDSSNLECSDSDDFVDNLPDDLISEDERDDDGSICTVNSREEEPEEEESYSNGVCKDDKKSRDMDISDDIDESIAMGGDDESSCNEEEEEEAEEEVEKEEEEEEEESFSSNLFRGDDTDGVESNDNVNDREEEKPHSTLWQSLPQVEFAAPQKRDERNAEFELRLKKVPKKADKVFVKDNKRTGRKWVRYNCRCCDDFGKYFSLDLYRDPNDKSYDPAKDSRLIEGNLMFFQSHDSPLPITDRQAEGLSPKDKRGRRLTVDI